MEHDLKVKAESRRKFEEFHNQASDDNAYDPVQDPAIQQSAFEEVPFIDYGYEQVPDYGYEQVPD